jgi:hypothetical protein
MFFIGILVLLTVAAIVALAKRSPRGITVAVWVVGSTYAIVGFGITAALLAHGIQPFLRLTALGLPGLACGLAAATATLVHRRHPVLAAGLLMAGAFVIAAGVGFLAAGLAAWGGDSVNGVVVVGVVATLIAFGPALLTGVALIRGPKVPLAEARL